MATPAIEGYLEVIYMMSAEGQPVIGARLAESLHVSRPTVTITLKRMVRDGLIKLNAHKEIALTAKGQAIAEYLQRRHRIVERWLVDVLGLDWAKSDAEAHRLEHAMSDEVAELLNQHLGKPATCPHGNPIPGNVQSVALDSKTFPLNQTHEGDRVKVMRISEYAENVSELLDYLGKRGIMPGASITVSEIAPLDGLVTLKVGNKMVPMSRQVAGFVWVKRE